MTDGVQFYINGKRHARSDAALFQPLSAFLRDGLRLTGTKVVCAEGACGTCTVLVGRPQDQIGFGDLAHHAYRERVSLGERSFYATPGLDSTNPFRYYTTGGALAEVLVNRRTGEMTVARVDVLMDIGQPINQAIDRGQLIGGFVQGQGWVTTEELKHDADGALMTGAVSGYKIPSVHDIPQVFNVAFVENAENPVGVASSKTVGETPLRLAVSVWTAVKDALASACGGLPPLPLPATPGQILLCLHRQARLSQPRSPGVAAR